MSFTKGDKVTYVGGTVPEKGIVKGVSRVNRNSIFVVYHCDDNWEDYENYTAELTRRSSLKRGWIDEKPYMEIRPDLKRLYDVQKEWSQRAFGDDKPIDGILNHLMEEIEEVRQNPDDPIEWADLLMLVLDGVWRSEISYLDFYRALEHKIQVNRLRKWKPMNDKGYFKHEQ